MRKRNYPNISRFKILFSTRIYLSFVLLFFCYTGNAQGSSSTGTNSIDDEKKVDYLEQIYFSGGTKADLNTSILITLQTLQGKSPTQALAKQVTFLLEIKDKADQAENACDLLELLAAGIYNIDPAEAKMQGVIFPSDKAKANTGDAIANLNKLNSSASNLNRTTSNLVWSNYLLSGRKSNGFINGAGKVGNTAGTIGNTAGVLGQTAETGKDVVALKNALFKKKDKPCNDVKKKDIEIGEHGPPVVNEIPGGNVVAAPNVNAGPVVTTIISIPGVSSGMLRSLTDSVRIKPGVQSAERTYQETVSTITVLHTGKTDALADWFEDKFSSKIKIVDYGNGKINLALKK